MCGIAGFHGQDRDRIEKMTKALWHRGPDGQGIMTESGISLGHARLRILDPRPEGDQPMWNAERTVVMVYNGEIFNYRRIREEERFACTTNTDTEVLLKLYERYGIRFVEKLLGMFAFALYDTRTKTFHLARDQSGIKPLFLSYPGGTLHFASEVRALMAALPAKPALNMRSLSLYMRLQYVPGPETLVEGITSLPPGTILSWTPEGETRMTFAPNVPSRHYGSRDEFKAEFPDLMDGVVADHLLSDRPVGIFLSGGMDSSVILHHMCNHAEKPVRTFTVRFEASEEEGAARFNTDAELARQTAKHYGTEHTEVFLTAELFRDLYRDTARALDQPNADSVAVAQALLAREAKKSVDVVLCGAGGDELFGGYPRYRIARILELLQWMPATLRAFGGSPLGYPPDVLMMHPGPLLAERLLARPVEEFIGVIRGNWFDPDATTRLFAERWNRLRDGPPAGGPPQPDSCQTEERAAASVSKFMNFDRHLWLVDESLRLTDATTMGSSVEGRVPFLDPRIIAASHGTEISWHVTPLRTKALLKDTYRNILPGHLFTLSKASFYPPLAKWLRREAAPLVEETLEHPRMRELFQMEHVRQIFETHRSHHGYALHLLSSLMQLRYWFETVYDSNLQ